MMMNFKKLLLALMIFSVIIISIGDVSATSDLNNTLTHDISVEQDDISSIDNSDNNEEVMSQYVEFNEENVNSKLQEIQLGNPYGIIYQNESDKLSQSKLEEELSASDEIITVNDWNELQYYCSLTDKDYTLKLKENTNFYPLDTFDINQQVKIKNNVKIIGSEGSWFGDSSSSPKKLLFLPILVEDNAKVGLTLDNITFKWIDVGGSSQLPDGMFIRFAGKKTTTIRNCNFHDITTTFGHSCIVYLKKGSAILDNCSFTDNNCNYGVVSIYDPNSVTTTHMIIQNCYFENNYASTEPGCINNCGKITVYNTTFVKNRSFWWGGAIHTHSGASTTIYDSYFIDNVAGWNGGAIYTYSDLKIYNSVFIGNNCTANNGGGAIGACAYGSNPHIYIEGCLFENNENLCWSLDEISTTGTGRGGAISFMDEGSLEVKDSTFIANAASIGAAICAISAGEYGSPNVIITNNTFINHTRSGDTLNVRVSGTTVLINNNHFQGNSIVFSNLTLSKLSEGKEQATFEVTASLTNPTYYDEDILYKTNYQVYVNDNYLKTVNSTVFSVDFGDLDICDVYVIPTISNRKSNAVTAVSTREYIFVSKSSGNDLNNGLSRDTPVSTIAKALELAKTYQNIILLDGTYDENIYIDYDVTIKGETNATLSKDTKFTVNCNNFTLKNLNIKNLSSDTFITQNNGNLLIEKCIVLNNPNLLISNNGQTIIRNSILLNNSKILKNNENYNLDGNWWGNSLPTNLTINSYLVLNLTADKVNLEYKESSNVGIDFYLNGQVYNNLPVISFNVTALNGTANIVNVNAGQKIIYTLTDLENGSLSVSYNDFLESVDFIFAKSNPKIQTQIKDIMVGDDLIVTVTTPNDTNGNITVCINDINQTKLITEYLTSFTFSNLKAGTYSIAAVYSGDKKYLSQNMSSEVKVSRYNSTLNIEFGNIEVGENLTITVSLNSDATGNVTLYVNSQVTELTLDDARANYTIKNIKRGDYRIKAVYNGDNKYLESESYRFIEVDNLNAAMIIKTDDITYGDCAIFEIKLNDNATGNVSVTVDGITNTSQVTDGLAMVYLYDLNAGVDKIITVFYSGDDTYFNLTDTSKFTINKADLTFNITSEDIMIGQNAVIKITVAKRIGGTFTIEGQIINIPLSGEIEYVISDLEIGEYDITAIYDGNNYNTISNTTSFNVFEYLSPQWPNSGSTTTNTGKSEYESNSNGGIAYVIQIADEIIESVTVDSEGNIYITTPSAIYSYDNMGNFRWNYSINTVEGNFSGTAISRDVIIAPKSGDTLYFINQTSGERYGSSNIYQGSSFYAPIVDAGANVYIISELQVESNSYKLVKIPYNLWYNGGDPILIDIGNSKPIASPTFNEDIIVILMDGRLRVFDAESLDAKFSRSGNYLDIRPVVGEGNIIYAAFNDRIFAYTSTGSTLWYSLTKDVPNQLILDNENALYYVTDNGLYSCDLIDGKQTLIFSLKITSGVLIDVNHNLYFGCDNLFYAIDSNGKVLWKTDFGSKVTGNPVMNKGGIIYVTTEDNKLFALGNATAVVNGTNSSDGGNSTPVGNGTGEGNSTPVGNDTNGSAPSNTDPSNGGSNTSPTTKVVKKSSKITAKKKTFKKSLKTKKYTVTLKSGKTPIKKVKLIIKIGKKTFKAKTNAKGKATFKIKLTKKGKYTAKITFKGNKYYKATTKKVKIVLK